MLVAGGSAGTFKSPFHKYDTAGTYRPKLIVNTNDGCNNTYQKSIFILPYSTVTPLPTSAYREDFEGTNGGYQVESFGHPMDSSWVWSVPNGININSGTKSWWTGRFNFHKGTTYDSAEISVVNGPCFNLQSLSRPMISFDYWVNTPNSNNDGAALQYSIDGGLNWSNIGTPGKGINWYSSNLIVSNPGGQPAGYGPYGWSGATQTGWKRAAFNLDTILSPVKNDQVRIRFAFAGDANKNINAAYNGFAFDNVFVGDKTKNVLVEQFTNENKAGSDTADIHFDALMRKEIKKRGVGNADFVSLQYHVRFPQPDVFSQSNAEDPAARALYYNVQGVPYSMLDGIQTNTLPTASAAAGDSSNINAIEIDRRALRTPPLTITQIDTTGSTPTNHTLNVKVHIRADTAITYPLYAQVALVETPVVISSPDPNPGIYNNVVRKLLFAGDGVTKSGAMAVNDTQVFTKGDVEINAKIADPTKLYLVAFIQNFVTKEVLQSAVMPLTKKVGSLITGIEPSIAELEQIQIYPNPANGKFSFGTSGDFPDNCIWKIADQRGINVMTGNFNDAFNGAKSVDITSLTNGVYFVAIGAPGKNPVYKKLVVLNSN